MDEQAAIAEQQTFDAILEGMERISNLISRYAIFEDLYLHPQLKSYTGLERALTELYRRVLKYLSKAKRFYSKSTSGMPRLSSLNLMELPCHGLRGPIKLV
jgi:HD superfamily phosphohydrolase